MRKKGCQYLNQFQPASRVGVSARDCLHMWYIGLASGLLNYVLYGLVGWHENHMFVVQPVLFVKSHMFFVVTRYLLLLLLIEVHVFVVFSLLLVKVYALYKDRQQQNL
jgi:hypothetical protein